MGLKLHKITYDLTIKIQSEVNSKSKMVLKQIRWGGMEMETDAESGMPSVCGSVLQGQ